ncbi:MAG: hypothetical protein H8D67_26740 [Deltaproteobacteria bacterium]|nr:hypothetical protein [Deltaproteobacteria bacterium]
MINSFVLVKKLRSTSEELYFADFKLWKVGSNFDNDLRKAQHLFPKAWPLYEDYVYEKAYDDDDNGRERAPFDIEDALLLMRLFKTGDLFFLNPCIEEPNGDLSSQLPYPVMVYTHTANRYNIESEECAKFDLFASEILSLPNWSSGWFKTARRFFLYGGGKEYNPRHDLVDRIVDYITALEAILVPEKDFLGRRLRERAASLLKDHQIDINDTKRLLRDFYNVRSAVVHGGDISAFKDDVLIRNIDFESIVRKVIVEALRVLPPGDDRERFLKYLFDICDHTRSEKVFKDFCSIKDVTEKARCRDRILKR